MESFTERQAGIRQEFHVEARVIEARVKAGLLEIGARGASMEARCELFEDFADSTIIVALKTKLMVGVMQAAVIEKASICIPANWWQHLKHDLFKFLNRAGMERTCDFLGRWMRPRYDERPTETTRVEFVCPHGDTPFATGPHLHFGWMFPGTDFSKGERI